MIEKLKEAIDLADYTNNIKAKKALLKIAEMPEDKQEMTLEFVLIMCKSKEVKQQ